MKKFLLTFLMLIAAIPMWAFEVDGICYAIEKEGASDVGIVSNPNGYSGDLTIPSTVTYEGRTYNVVSIWAGAFKNCTGLTTITFPNSSLRKIYSDAFMGCTNLKYINCIVSSKNSYDYIEYIGDWAFYGCTSLKVIPVGTRIKEIGEGAFDDTLWYNNQADGILYQYIGTSVGEKRYVCLGYKGAKPTGTLTIQEGTTLIALRAFASCSGITDVVLPTTLSQNPSDALCETGWYNNQAILYSGDVCYGFGGAEDLDKTNVVIKSGTKTIFKEAFNGEYDIESLTIPESVTSIGTDAFAGCEYLTSVIIEDGTTELSGLKLPDSPVEKLYMGRPCSGKLGTPTLKEVTFGNSITSIGNEVFSGCSSLASVNIPESVTSIGDRAFYNCSSLASVNIPESVTSIGYSVFNGTAWYNSQPYGEVYLDNCLVDYKINENDYDRKTVEIKEDTRLVRFGAIALNSRLTAVFALPKTAPILSVPGLDLSNSSDVQWYRNELGNAPLYVPAEAYDSYWMSDVWSALFPTITPLIKVSDIAVEAPTTCIVGDSIQLNAVVMPNNATKPDVKWSSSNPDVASVDATGLLKYLKEGKTTITATATDGSDVSTSFDIEVKAIKATSIALDNKKVIVNVNDNTTLSATIAPEDVTVKAVEWSVSDEGLLSLIDNGNGTATVTQLAEGTAYVYVRTTDGTNLADTCEMTTFRPVESIVLDPVTATVGLYETATITATVYPENANNKDLNWTISDSSIGMLKKGANGTASVVLKAEGTVTVTATAADGSGATATCVVSTDVLVNEISLDKTEAELMIGETLTLNSSVGPDNAVNKEVQWRSNNEKVATVSVDANGAAIVTAIAAGEAIVSVFTVDGTNLIADCYITVARGEDAPNVVTLTINECEGGNVEIAVTEGETIDLAVNAMYGWKINSVAFNGEDVTADFIAGELFTTPAIVEDSELVIAYVKQSTGEEEVSLNATNVKVYGYDNVINIKGAEMGSVANVFDTEGVMIYSGIERSIPVANDGVYIVVVEGHTFKLAL